MVAVVKSIRDSARGAIRIPAAEPSLTQNLRPVPLLSAVNAEAALEMYPGLQTPARIERATIERTAQRLNVSF